MPQSTCPRCHQPARGLLMTVVDQHGSSRLCGLCLVLVLQAVEASGDVTVFVADREIADA